MQEVEELLVQHQKRLLCGGQGPVQVVILVESWDGSSWTEVAEIVNATKIEGGVQLEFNKCNSLIWRW